MQEFNVIKKQDYYDAWTYGHVLFGCMISAIFIIVFNVLSSISPSDIVLLEVLLLILSIGIFTTWEILEHSIIKKHVYIKKLGMKDWRESRWNSIFDVVIAASFFCLLFYPNCFLNFTIWYPIFILLFCHATIPFVVRYANGVDKKR